VALSEKCLGKKRIICTRETFHRFHELASWVRQSDKGKETHEFSLPGPLLAAWYSGQIRVRHPHIHATRWCESLARRFSIGGQDRGGTFHHRGADGRGCLCHAAARDPHSGAVPPFDGLVPMLVPRGIPYLRSRLRE